MPALLLAALLLVFPSVALPSPFTCSAKGGAEWRIHESEHVVLRTDLSPSKDVLPMARASVQAHPGDWRAWSTLGDALEKGPRDEWLAARRKAVEAGPSEPVAQVAMSLGLCADALRAQQRAIDTLSDRATPEGRIEKEKVLAACAQRCAAPAGAAPAPPTVAPAAPPPPAR